MKFLLKRRVPKEDKPQQQQQQTSADTSITAVGFSASTTVAISDQTQNNTATLTLTEVPVSSRIGGSNNSAATAITTPTIQQSEEQQQQQQPQSSTVSRVFPRGGSPPSRISPRQVSPPPSSVTRRRTTTPLGDSSRPPSLGSPMAATASNCLGGVQVSRSPAVSSNNNGGRPMSPSPRSSSSSTIPTAATIVTHGSLTASSSSFPSSEVTHSVEPVYKDSDMEEEDPFAALPLLKDVPASETQDLFKRKLEACSIVYDFNRNINLRAKESKRQTLLELVEFMNNSRNCFTDPIMQTIVQTVSANIFRTLAPPTPHAASLSVNFDPEEDEPTLESGWPHLQIVYEFFLRFVVSSDVDPKSAKRYIDQQFVLKLLELFASEDPRERDYLKTILHRIYGKIMALRSFIRRAIQHTFYGFVYEQECHKGVSELLEILGSIINGFALPLKEEHKIFLERSLIPLHKARSLSAFHQQLTYCMTQYVEKDNRLSEVIIMGLLRFWPVTNTNKEVVFLNELEEILDLTQPTEFQKVMIPLFRQMALCIQSPHFQVAERVLFFWNNEYIVNMFNSNKEQLFPIIISALYKNSKDHWNSTVHGLTYNVSKLLAEVDPDLFDDCSDKNLANEESRAKEEEGKEDKWKQLEHTFSSSRPNGIS